LEAEKLKSALEDKKKAALKARDVRTEYNVELDAVKNWLKSAQERLQNRSSEPVHLKENVQV